MGYGLYTLMCYVSGCSILPSAKRSAINRFLPQLGRPLSRRAVCERGHSCARYYVQPHDAPIIDSASLYKLALRRTYHAKEYTRRKAHIYTLKKKQAAYMYV